VVDTREALVTAFLLWLSDPVRIRKGKVFLMDSSGDFSGQGGHNAFIAAFVCHSGLPNWVFIRNIILLLAEGYDFWYINVIAGGGAPLKQYTDLNLKFRPLKLLPPRYFFTFQNFSV